MIGKRVLPLLLLVLLVSESAWAQKETHSPSVRTQEEAASPDGPGQDRHQQDEQTTDLGKVITATETVTDSTTELPLFGHDFFFSGDSSTYFEESPLSPDYLLGPGDEVIVNIWGKLNFGLRQTVDASGYLLLPGESRLSVNGLRFGELKTSLLGKLRGSYAQALTPEKLSSGAVSVDITLGKLRGVQLLITGEVSQPGGYTFKKSSVLLMQALARAGGIGPEGSLRSIQISHRGKTRTVDLYDFFIFGNIELDAYRLQHEDVIFVPVRTKTVSIEGGVTRPMAYELTTDEPLKDLLKIAGGLIHQADISHIQIKRTRPSTGPQLIDIDLSQGADEQTTHFSLLDGDIVKIPVFPQRRRGFFVHIAGSGVHIPGIYQLEDKGNLETLIKKAGGLYEDVLRERVELVRINSDYSKSLLTIDLNEIDMANFPLQSEDQFTFYATFELVGGTKHVELQGHVKSPGSYPLAENMTLYDLLFSAGGFSDLDFRAATYLERGSLVRIDKETGGQVLLPFKLGQILEQQNNLALQSGDQIVIYAAKAFADSQAVTIKGEVRVPGTYPLYREMTLDDLVVEAAGVKERADSSRIEVVRRNASTDPEERSVQTLFVDFHQQADSFVLQNNDLVLVRPLPRLRQATMTLSGEFVFPGEYSLAQGDQHLSQLIKRIGGTAESAFLEGATFYRRSSTKRRPVAIDLEKVLTGSARHDIILADGDSLHLPQKNWTVEVKGAVRHPQIVQYIPSKKAKYYIDRAGGFTDSTDAAAIHIIRANRLVLKASKRFWFDPDVPPGSTIVVPRRNAVRVHHLLPYGIGFSGGALSAALVFLIAN